MPEGHLARLAGCRRHQHAIVGDLLDPPCRRTQRERVADLRFEDHFLVELADARRTFSAREKHTVKTPGQESCRRSRSQPAWHSRPTSLLRTRSHVTRGRSSAKASEVSSRQHVEHAFEHPPAQRRERCSAAHGSKQVLGPPFLGGHHRNDSVASTSSGLRGIVSVRLHLVHGTRDGGARDEVAPKLWKDDSPLIAPARCPARPTRWSPLATDGGDSICTTRSIAPMSMPSSRADVAASARMRPSFSRSSTSVRVSRASEPVRPDQRLACQDRSARRPDARPIDDCSRIRAWTYATESTRAAADESKPRWSDRNGPNDPNGPNDFVPLPGARCAGRCAWVPRHRRW